MLQGNFLEKTWQGSCFWINKTCDTICQNSCCHRENVEKWALVMVVIVYPPDHDRVTLNTQVLRSVSVPSLGKLSSTCLHFHKELLQLYMPKQWYSASDSRKDFMINHNENTCTSQDSSPECSIHSRTPYQLAAVRNKY